jgi:hypothetical protein
MTNQDGHRNLPTRRKRITHELLWICCAAAVAGIVASAMSLGFWSSTALTADIMLAVMLPLGIAAKRERKRLESRPNSESREPRI